MPYTAAGSTSSDPPDCIFRLPLSGKNLTTSTIYTLHQLLIECVIVLAKHKRTYELNQACLSHDCSIVDSRQQGYGARLTGSP